MTTLNKVDLVGGIDLTAELDVGYADTLRGAREPGRGSFTEKGLDELPDDYACVIAEDQSSAGEGTVIYQGPDGGLGGHEGIVTLQQALDSGMEVKARLGKHGPELYTEAEEAYVKTPVLTYIIATDGNPDGLKPGALVTWYPGKPTPPLPQGAAVKLIHQG